VDIEAGIGVTTVVVAVATIGVMFYLDRRKKGEPDFSVARFKLPGGWLVTAHNQGAAEARRAWCELVPEVNGRVTAVTPGVVSRVAVDAEIEFVVNEAELPTGFGVELCWVDRHRQEHRQRVPLPNRAPGADTDQS
jgi:hypothetical protein